MPVLPFIMTLLSLVCQLKYISKFLPLLQQNAELTGKLELAESEERRLQSKNSDVASEKEDAYAKFEKLSEGMKELEKVLIPCFSNFVCWSPTFFGISHVVPFRRFVDEC